MNERVAEYLYMRGAKMGRAGCQDLAPHVVAKVNAGASVDALADYLYYNGGTPNKKSAQDIAVGVQRMVRA